mmetsp:Transcript_29089/g.25728  ORF Transcript_29089/g.25728 Transcript_29089/m.25728 type:complete len:173 (+) Transcript_29089:131-649(+)
MSTGDIFFSNMGQIKDSVEKSDEKEDSIDDENLIHQSFTLIDQFMLKFFNLPIFQRTEKEPLKELAKISEVYKEYIERINEEVSNNPQLKNKAEENVICINNLISTKYAKYDIIKSKIKDLDHQMNQKFYEIRYSNFVPEKLNHPVWKKPMRELRCISYEKSPHKKMEALVK